jgi:non-specific serine/threonine protein kinase
MRGELDEADRAHRDGLDLMRSVGDRTGIALGFEGLAMVAAARHDRRRAARLAASADAAWAAVPRPAPDLVASLRRSALAQAGVVEVAPVGDAALDDLVRAALGRDVGPVLKKSTPSPSEPALSEREREVATLVAEGLTNRQIADRLVLSPRTIESHVARIMGRLGVDSRAQIAAWVASRGRDTEAVEMQ